MQPTHESSAVHHQAITESRPYRRPEARASHLFSALNAFWTPSPRRPWHACTLHALLLFALCWLSATTRLHLPAVAVTPCCPLQPL